VGQGNPITHFGSSAAAAGFYYYDAPVAINGKQMGLPGTSYAKQDRNNIKKGGSTGGLLGQQNSYPVSTT